MSIVAFNLSVIISHWQGLELKTVLRDVQFLDPCNDGKEKSGERG